MTAGPVCRVAPPEFLSDPALAALLDLLPEARVAGGAVRDALAGRAPVDIDLASPLPPKDVMARLTEAGVKAVPTGLAHGTVTAVVAGRPVEITTLRRDVETDGRHAVVAFTDDWREDAARRDFTINALSMTRDGSVYDYFGGIADLRAGRLRFVGDPAARVAEDYLRVLRFFRFFARYGAGEPDAATLAALADAVPKLASLSAERVWHELSRILAAPDPMASIRLMERLGVLAAIVPEGTDGAALARMVARGAPADPVSRLAALLTGDIAAFAARLKLSAAERDRLLALRAAPLATPEDDDAALRRRLADTPADILIDRTFLGGGDGPAWAALRERLRATPRPVFPLEGRMIVALGVPPGPRVGEVLRAVRGWWLAGGCVAAAAACLGEARRVVRAPRNAFLTNQVQDDAMREQGEPDMRTARARGPGADLLHAAGQQKYACILADPAWQFINRTGKVAPEHRRLSRYGTMDLATICGLPVDEIAAPTAHLYLWVPNALLPDGLRVMSEWGFQYRSNIIWRKIRKDGGSDGRGVGFYFRNVTEVILFGVRGKHARTLQPGRTQVNYLETRRREHSRKPDEIYPIIEACSPGPRIELFARGVRPGWTVWGDEAAESYKPTWKTYPHNSAAEKRLIVAE